MKKFLALMLLAGFLAATAPADAKHGRNGNWNGFGNRNWGSNCGFRRGSNGWGSRGWNNAWINNGRGNAYGQNWQMQRRSLHQMQRAGLISKDTRKFLSRRFNNGRGNNFWF